MNERQALVLLYRSALAAVHGGRAVERALPACDPGSTPVTLLAVGKAACAMAEGARAHFGERLRAGEVTTKAGHARPLPGLHVREASHPLPDERAVAAARAAVERARALGRNDVLLVLVSGGASALWTLPAGDLELADLVATSELLLRSGADIAAINCVRRHLDDIKGGGLARAAAPARVLALLLSDVRGDAIDAIGSGPTAPDPTRFAEALAVLQRHGLLDVVPRAVRAHLERGASGEIPENPAPGDPLFVRVESRVVARLQDALDAAANAARRGGLAVDAGVPGLYGEARVEAGRLVEAARRARGARVDLLVAGGEPSVRVRGDGRGGRAQELALAFAIEVEGDEAITALFAGSDGTDGPTRAAGAVVDGGTLARARVVGLDARAYLERNDSHPLLEASGDLLYTGPTDTNVGDLALVRVRRPGRAAARTWLR